MKYCNKCAVSVDSPVTRCPLCYATLVSKDNEPEPVSYPDLETQAEKYNIFFRVLLFLSLSVSVVCTTINFLAPTKTWWSLIVVANILYMWIAISTALQRRAKLGYNVLIQGLCLAVMILIFDRFFDSKVNWAFNYALPFLFLTATLSITIIVIIKRMKIRDFILYFILTALMGFVPLLLIAVGLVDVIWPSVVSAVYSGLALVSIFVFADNATKVELKKRLHI